MRLYTFEEEYWLELSPNPLAEDIVDVFSLNDLFKELLEYSKRKGYL